MSRHICVLQLGMGRVGGAVIQLVVAQAARWLAAYDVDVRHCGIADATALVMADAGDQLTQARLSQAELTDLQAAHAAGQRLAARPCAIPWSRWEDALTGALTGVRSPADVVVLDCTSGHTTTPLLLAARAAGAHIVLANKDPLTGSMAQYTRLVDSGAGGSARVSATVGAGLPVVATLAALVASGDTLLDLGARASGSLGFLCGALAEGVAYDVAVRQAAALGYTEPNPRQDLSGFDVARKVLILARTAGIGAELADVQVESLVPPGADSLELGEFQSRLLSYADHLADRFTAARAAGRTLRYVGRIDASGALSAELVELETGHALAAGHGPDNIFLLRTARYDAHPIIIRGPGAGIEVTAGAVVGDLLRALGVLS